ncbi:MAG: hypothetical protein FJ280_13035 [Planctomycetes bacterium]|nr:hypothetical protein [Planctomycetota bacterium]
MPVKSGGLAVIAACLVALYPAVAPGAGVPGGTPTVVINEVLASNNRSGTDPQGEYEDWIELYNRGSTPVNVGGMYLTDDPDEPTKWQFPTGNPAQTTIPARGYLLVWADDEPGDPGLHATFKLSAAGEGVALIDRDGKTLIDSVHFGPQRVDVSYGRFPDGADTWSLLDLPTPGARNVRLYEGHLAAPQVYPGHGFYDGPVQVTITCDVPGATIYYTRDGSEPYLTSTNRPNPAAAVYSGPLLVNKTTCLRAAATRTNWKVSPISTQTYIFVADVVRQCADGRSPGGGWPSGSVNGQVFDYAMDPDIVTHPLYRDLMDDALLSIPSISLVTNLAHLVDPARGIYVHAGSEGRDWERPVSVELIHPDGRAGFQIDAGIRIRGGFSRTGANPKHSFRLFFRNDYGPPVLKYPLFDAEGADEFKHIDLRTAQNYAWSLQSSNPGEKNTFVREVFCRDLQRETGQPYTRTRYYHLYLNGLYWGLYESQERSEASYAATYFGGAPDEYDVVKADNYRTSYTDGSIDDWNLLWSLCQQGFDTDQRYYAVQGRNPDGTEDPRLPVHVDVVNLIDYMLGIFYTGNDDAPVTLGGDRANNFFAIRNRRLEARQGWQLFAYDNEHSLGVLRGVSDDRTGPVTAGQSRDHFNPQWLHQKLMVHTEYRLLFADRAHRHLYNDGAMTPQRAIALCLARASQIELAIIAESARWGDHRPARANNPYTKADWWAEVDGYLAKTFFPVRTGIVLNQLRNRGLYPQVTAPVFQVHGAYRHGGHLAATERLSLAGGGTIWYTLDGTDPRLPGKAGDTAAAQTLVAATGPKRVLVPARDIGESWKSGGAYDDSAWTPVSGAPGGVGYERGTGYASLISLDVGSLMYGSGKSTSCYIRIPFSLAVNPSQFTTLVLNVRYDDGFVAYLNGTEIQRALFSGTPRWNSAASSNHEADSVESFVISSSIPLLRQGQNLLAIHGLNVSTSSSDFLIWATLEAARTTGAQDSGISPSALRYTGPVLLPHSVQVKARTLSGTTWSALNEAVFAVGPVAQGLRISEIMYHPLNTGHPNDPNTEYIELTNIAAQSIDLNLVRFTKGIGYTFPSFTLPPGGYCLVVKDLAAFQAKYGSNLPVVGRYTGSLDNSGERIEFVDAVGQIIQSFRYEDNWFKSTDGQGYSLTVKDPKTSDADNLNDKNAWEAAIPSPGRANP